MLVCPKREVKRFADLTADETSDLWLAAKEIGGKLERYHEATSLTFTIQVIFLALLPSLCGFVLEINCFFSYPS